MRDSAGIQNFRGKASPYRRRGGKQAGDRLQRDAIFHSGIPGEINLAHTARAQPRFDMKAVHQNLPDGKYHANLETYSLGKVLFRFSGTVVTPERRNLLADGLVGFRREKSLGLRAFE